MKYGKEQQSNQRKRKDGRLRSTKIIGMFILVTLVVSPLAAEMAPTSFMPSPELDVQQQEITDQELMTFGIALVEVQEIQIQANEEINKRIQNSELPIERLDEIFMIQQQSPESLEQEVSDAEITEFNHVMETITAIHEETETKVVDSLAQYSYNIESFNRMASRIQEDSKLLDRLQTLFSNQQEGI